MLAHDKRKSNLSSEDLNLIKFNNVPSDNNDIIIDKVNKSGGAESEDLIDAQAKLS